MQPKYFTKRQDMFSGTLRLQYSDQLYQPRCRTDIYKRNAYNMSIRIFNELPTHIKSLEGKEFHKTLRKWLSDCGFYNMTEFFNYKHSMT